MLTINEVTSATNAKNYGSSGKSVLFPSDSTVAGYVEDFLRHDLGVRWFLMRSSYQSVL